jgi:hypothetical protein
MIVVAAAGLMAYTLRFFMIPAACKPFTIRLCSGFVVWLL